MTARGIAALALTTGTVLAGVVAPTAANATTVQFTDPTTGCTHYVYTPDVTIQNGPPEGGIVVSGGFGQSVSCP